MEQMLYKLGNEFLWPPLFCMAYWPSIRISWQNFLSLIVNWNGMQTSYTLKNSFLQDFHPIWKPELNDPGGDHPFVHQLYQRDWPKDRGKFVQFITTPAPVFIDISLNSQGWYSDECFVIALSGVPSGTHASDNQWLDLVHSAKASSWFVRYNSFGCLAVLGRVITQTAKGVKQWSCQ